MIVFSLCLLILVPNDVTGVKFMEWKAKEGECEKCGESGGEITIERTCVPDNEYSCNGWKVEKMMKDCVEYCGRTHSGGTGRTHSCK